MTASNETGAAMFELVNTVPPKEPRNAYRQAALDVVFGQLWPRPGLTRRQRRWVSLTAAGMTGGPVAITAQVYGALNSEDISTEEMGEFLLHFACYAGFPKTTMLDSAVDTVLDRIATERGEPLPQRPFAPLHTADPTLVHGLDHGPVWSRPQLARPDRRLVTLTCLAVQGAHDPLRAHVTAALEAGELDVAALREVALHAGFYAGITVRQALDTATTEASATKR